MNINSYNETQTAHPARNALSIFGIEHLRRNADINSPRERESAPTQRSESDILAFFAALGRTTPGFLDALNQGGSTVQKSNENSVEQHREAVRETAGLPEPAATERRRRQEVLKAKGWRVLPFRPTPPSGRPMAGVRHLGNGAWELSPEVWDHAYRLAHTSGRVLYVGEPSQLTAKALTQIQQLRDAGWRVAVRPHRALHYPGHTIAVHVQEPVTTVEKARTTKVFETLLEDLLYHGNGTWWTGCAGCGGNQMISGSAVWPACDPLFTPHVAGCVIARYLPTWRADARAHRGSVRLTRLAQCQPNDRQLEPDSREPA